MTDEFVTLKLSICHRYPILQENILLWATNFKSRLTRSQFFFKVSDSSAEGDKRLSGKFLMTENRF